MPTLIQKSTFRNSMLVLTLFCLNMCAFDTSKDEAKKEFDTIPWQQHIIQWKQSKLGYYTTGKPTGSVLLFIHGSPGGWGGWIDYLKDSKLRKSFQLIALDRPGYGLSKQDAGIGSLEKQASAIRAVVLHNQQSYKHSRKNRLENQEVYLVAHSLGGPIAIRYAMDNPSAVKGLVLIASPANPELEEWLWFNKLAEMTFVRFFLPKAWDISNQELKPLKNELTQIQDQYQKLNIATLILHGAQDSLVPFANADYLKKKMGHARGLKVWLPSDEGHFFVWSKRDVVIKKILSFLNGKKR